MDDFPKLLKRIWIDWDIRVFFLLSLLFQILLIMFSSLRKRIASKSFVFFIWSVYLLADWVADFALGLLCNSLGKSDRNDATRLAVGGTKIIKTTGTFVSKQSTTLEYKDKLLAFWAPFLLLHLGGPDTIIALAMEDNKLWTRHLLGLLFEAGAAVYAFLLSIHNNSLLAPTLLMFFAGTIKYGERTYSLYLASCFAYSGPKYAEFDYGEQSYIEKGPEYAMFDYGGQSYIKNFLALREQKTEDDEKKEEKQQTVLEVQKIQEAHKFFNKFEALTMELIFSSAERNESRRTFLKKPAQEAFGVVEYELNFLYEALSTKAVVVHHRHGCVLRIICSFSIMGAFLSFFFLSKKHNFSPLDKAVTYTLLGGAISLDALGFIMLILSDWTTVKLSKFGFGKLISWFLIKIPPRNRWSVTVKQHNLINYCIPSEESYFKNAMDRPTILGKLDEIFCIQRTLRWMNIGTQLIDEIQYTCSANVTDAFKEFIFEELRKKAEGASSVEENRSVPSGKGKRGVRERDYLGKFLYGLDAEFDESLLAWHIATDLCYYAEEDMGKKSHGQDQKIEGDICLSIKASENCRFCKLLSDYLAYLLVMRPFMMSSSAPIGQIKYRDTCKDAKNFFRVRQITGNGSEENQRVGCNNLLRHVNTEDSMKEDKIKYVLFDACGLAKILMGLEVGKRLELGSEVLMELLIYAAARCLGIAHAQRLREGGELLTFVWVLMIHFGLGEQYRPKLAMAATTIEHTSSTTRSRRSQSLLHFADAKEAEFIQLRKKGDDSR